MAEVKPSVETFAKIKVIGIGGSGGNAVNRMIASRLKGVEFIAMNTDVQALHYSNAPFKLHIGKSVTRGLGAGMNPDLGAQAAQESQNEIRDILKGADMVFVTCGLGGGTGTGAAPMIAEIARDLGALTVAVVTKPFGFEGAQRRDIADRGFERLAERADTVITIPNDRVLQMVEKKTTLVDAFGIVDDVLRQGVQGISELITIPGLINVDFADVKAIMEGQGSALMSIGKATGEHRATEAAKAAVASPLLEVSIDGARGILFVVSGSHSMTMHEVAEAAKVITGTADANAKVIFGSVIDDTLKDEMRITVIATGFDPKSRLAPLSATRSQNTASSKSKTEEALAAMAPRMTVFEPAQTARPFTAKSLTSDDTSAAPTRKTLIQDSFKEENTDDIDIPAFIRKKMR